MAQYTLLVEGCNVGNATDPEEGKTRAVNIARQRGMLKAGGNTKIEVVDETGHTVRSLNI